MDNIEKIKNVLAMIESSRGKKKNKEILDIVHLRLKEMVQEKEMYDEFIRSLAEQNEIDIGYFDMRDSF